MCRVQVQSQWNAVEPIKLKLFNAKYVNIVQSKCQSKIVRDSAFRIGVGSSFHQPGPVNENVLERDFVPLCDSTTKCHSLADLRLLEGM